MRQRAYPTVTTRRPIRVARVPDGGAVELPEGVVAHVTQSLGSSFTLLVDGQLVRLNGADADAIGRPIPGSDIDAGSAQPRDLPSMVWQVLHGCYDPEIPVDIVELGLIYGCDIDPMDDGRMRVKVRMTLTAPGCGMGELLANEVCDKLLTLPQVGEATVQLVFDPPWDRSRMSEGALLSLGL